MPPFTITDPDDIARVTIVTRASSAAFIPEMSFSHWIRGCAGLTVDQVATAIEVPLAVLLGATTADGIRPVLSTLTSIIRTEVSKPLLSPPPVSDDTTRALAGAGTSLLPPDVAMVVSFRSDTSGAAFRSRSYIGGVAQGIMDGSTGLFGAGQTAALAADWMTYLAALQALAGDFEQITVSRYENQGGVPVLRPDPLGATVVQVLVDVHPDVQRRRGVR